jgi:hypothetical protein
MNKYRQNRILILGFALIFICIFISSSLHYHNDGKYHEDCLLCQYSSFLHSIQTESTFALYSNYAFFIKINQNNLQIHFYISIQKFFIRPPPYLV